ncbi:MAG TPA: zinc ribbon domain-containing protein, partial [Blastocatellia bacterium]|nr:zinc ribbon domain-containing protein [Blastocatellia bacterium]
MMGVCPQCGTRTLPQQNFCRRCGTDLRGLSSGWRVGERPPGASASRIQILSDVVHDALSAGVSQIKAILGELQTGDRIAALRRIGFWFFWVGLAALLDWVNGLILIAVGIGLMAYARGFFRTKSASPSAVTGETRWD